MHDRFVRRFISTLKCSVCGHRYEPAKVTVVGSHDDMWFLNAFCSNCQTTGLIAAVVKDASLVQTVTELTRAEMEKFKDFPPICGNDVLDMYLLMKDFQGNVDALFAL